MVAENTGGSYRVAHRFNASKKEGPHKMGLSFTVPGPLFTSIRQISSPGLCPAPSKDMVMMVGWVKGRGELEEIMDWKLKLTKVSQELFLSSAHLKRKGDMPVHELMQLAGAEEASDSDRQTTSRRHSTKPYTDGQTQQGRFC